MEISAHIKKDACKSKPLCKVEDGGHSSNCFIFFSWGRVEGIVAGIILKADLDTMALHGSFSISPARAVPCCSLKSAIIS